MRIFLRRMAKPSTPLDVLGPDTVPTSASDSGSDLTGPDEAYDDLVERGLIRRTVPAAEIIARVQAEAVSA